jgi:hypothetical protein
MTITIDATDTRSIKALEIAAGASGWAKVRTRDGRALFGIPSSCQPGRFYLVDVDRQQCDCPDFKRHGLTGTRIGQIGTHSLCKHLRAAQLHLELVKAAEQATPKRRRLQIVRAASRYDQIFGEEPAF